jgi:hypothetical protein
MDEQAQSDEQTQSSDEPTSSSERAEETKNAWNEAEEKMRKLEEDPPKDLEEWPDDEAKYVTFGGGEGDHGYEEGPESKLGPSGLRRFEDGSITIDNEEVDDPEQYKADEPIEGATQTGEGDE